MCFIATERALRMANNNPFVEARSPDKVSALAPVVALSRSITIEKRRQVAALQKMIFRSPFPDVSIPEISITPFILQRAAELGDKPALIDGPSGSIITYAKLADSISRVAASLAARGFKKGEVFGILSPNIPEYA